MNSTQHIPSGYKQTEVGVIPVDWEVRLLDDICERGSGHTPSKKFPEYWNGNIKWVSLQDTFRLDKVYINETTSSISDLGIKNSSAKILKKGTVLLSRDAGVGKSTIIADKMACSQHFVSWTCGNELVNIYLYYYLQQQKSEFERIAIGSTIKTIGLPYFRKYKAPIPTKAEQEAIAEALVDADAWIESLEKLIAKKRNLKQAAMQQLLTGQTRLPGFEGEWVTATIENIGLVGRGRVISHKEIGKSVNQKYPVYSSQTSSKGLMGYIDTYDFEGEYITWTTDGANAGTVFHRNGRFNCTNVCGTIKLVQDDNIFVSMLLNTVAKTHVSWHLGNPKLMNDVMKKISLKMPSCLEEQIAIAKVLSDMDAEIEALEAKLEKARRIKEGMMAELLTGKTRLVEPKSVPFRYPDVEADAEVRMVAE